MVDVKWRVSPQTIHNDSYNIPLTVLTIKKTFFECYESSGVTFGFSTIHNLQEWREKTSSMKFEPPYSLLSTSKWIVEVKVSDIVWIPYITTTLYN